MDRVGGDGRAVRALLLPYVVEGLLAALLHLVDPYSEDGRRQLPTYRVRTRSVCVCFFFSFRFGSLLNQSSVRAWSVLCEANPLSRFILVMKKEASELNTVP